MSGVLRVIAIDGASEASTYNSLLLGFIITYTAL